ncbi:MAG: hypothetical protein R3E87_18400 [Burkholderiaceae bacterium]
MSTPNDRPPQRRDAPEAFIAGEGALARLVRALPPFEPPPEMDARFAAQLDTLIRITERARAEHSLTSRVPQALQPAHEAGGVFEPPTRLAQAVLAEAARIDAAQAPRREALLRNMGSGPDGALVERLGDPAREWLSAQDEKRVPVESRASSRTPLSRWSFYFGGALAAALAAGIALNLWRAPGQVAAPDLIAQAPDQERSDPRAKRAEPPMVAESASVEFNQRQRSFEPSDEATQSRSPDRSDEAPVARPFPSSEQASRAQSFGSSQQASRAQSFGSSQQASRAQSLGSSQQASRAQSLGSPHQASRSQPRAADGRASGSPPSESAARRQSSVPPRPAVPAASASALPSPPAAQAEPAPALAARAAQALREPRGYGGAGPDAEAISLTATLDDDPAAIARRLIASGLPRWTLRASPDDAEQALVWLERLRAVPDMDRAALRVEPVFAPGVRGRLRLVPVR